MSGADDVSGWLPVEAQDQLQEEKARASEDVAEKLLALDPRSRVLALLDRAVAGRVQEGALLRPADLKRVLESFDGSAAPEEADLAQRLPGMLDA